jgi:xanthine/CO dehydrogenase XdhC/CoxF family maturation factor
VDVYVEEQRAEGRAVRATWRALLDGDAPFVVSTNLASGERNVLTTDRRNAERDVVPRDLGTGERETSRSGAGPHDTSHLHVAAGRETFIDVFTPPPQLLIVSAGDDARPLARLAASVGFRVVVVDRRPALLTHERFPHARLVESDAEHVAVRARVTDDTCAVVMTHRYSDDREYLAALLDTRAPYIGMLGPRQRTERIVAELGVTDPDSRERIYGPVGLDIGTDGAEQVALAVIGEILAVRSGRRPTSLRDRRAPIHAAVAD